MIGMCDGRWAMGDGQWAMGPIFGVPQTGSCAFSVRILVVWRGLYQLINKYRKSYSTTTEIRTGRVP